MRLKARIAVLLVVLAGMALLSSVCLLLLTQWLDRGSHQLRDAIESVRLSEASVQDLVVLNHTDNPRVRADLNVRIVARLRMASAYVRTEEERRVLAAAVDAVSQYVYGSRSDASYHGAYLALRDLTAVNVEQVHQVRADAEGWNRRGTLVGLAGALLVPAALLVAAILLERWERPVVELASAMERYAGGASEARAPETGPPEIREMAARFNGLASSLTRRHAAELAFFGGVAHDLRNPLGVMRLATAAARRAGVGADPVKLLDLVSRQVDALNRLVTDLVDAARVHSGRFALELNPCDLRAIAREVVELFEASGTSCVRLEAGDAAVVAHCDRARLGQVVINLVSNAVKYSPTGEEIAIRVAPEDGSVTLTVTDRGIGIPEEDLEAVFEPFRRGPGEGPPIAGAGLGLYVARRIVEEHGGRIELKSALGVGSTFRVVLPAIG